MTKRKRITLIQNNALVVVLLVFQSLYFRGSFRMFAQNHVTKQRDVTTLSHTYKPVQLSIADYIVDLRVPEGTDVHASPDKGESMQFSLYFTNSKLDFRGYVQVWKVTDIEHFLSDSRSLSPFDFRSYSITKVQGNNYHGLKTEWTANIGQNLISGKEYWLTLSSNEVARVSFFTDSAEFPREFEDMTQQISNSLIIAGTKNKNRLA